MKIEIDIDAKYSDTGVTITAPRLTQDIEKIISLMRMIDMKITARKVVALVMKEDELDPKTESELPPKTLPSPTLFWP